MATMDKVLLKEILDTISAAHHFLAQDLMREKLSTDIHFRRNQLCDEMETIMKKINSTHPSIRPRVNTPGKIAQPPPLAPKPPQTIPQEDEQQEVYEEPSVSESNPEDYLMFEPGKDMPQDGPQEDYLDMEAGEDRVEEETYEDPSQTMQQEPEEEQEVYEEPQPNLPPPSLSMPTQHPTSPHDQDAFPESTANTRGSRNSMLLSEPDWSDAYDTNAKKGEKVRVSDLSNVTHKGWVEKLGGRNQKSWQKRFCVISGVFMYFYEKDTSRTYNNRIALPQYVPNRASELTKKKQFAFKLSANTSVPSKQAKDYFFRVSSEEQCDEWVKELRAVFELCRAGTGGGMSFTMPRMPSSSPSSSFLAPDHLAKMRAASTSEIEQEDYEAVTAVIAEEEEQDDYIDVNPSSDVAGENGPEEDYVDLQPSEREIIEEEKEEDSNPQLPPSITARQPQLPPPPVLPKAPQQPLPPVLPKAPQQPLPPIPPPSSSSTPSTTANLRGYPPRPDPPVDTTKDYIQQPNGIQYNKVYVILWDFTASEKDELDLRRGDLVFVSDNKERQEWWYGELVNPDVTKKLGPKGLFPANYSSVAFQLVQ